MIDIATDLVTTIGVNADPPFNQPYGVSVSSDGSKVYVADMGNSLVGVINVSSGKVLNMGILQQARNKKARTKKAAHQCNV